MVSNRRQNRQVMPVQPGLATGSERQTGSVAGQGGVEVPSLSRQNPVLDGSEPQEFTVRPGRENDFQETMDKLNAEGERRQEVSDSQDTGKALKKFE